MTSVNAVRTFSMRAGLGFDADAGKDAAGSSKNPDRGDVRLRYDRRPNVDVFSRTGQDKLSRMR